MVDYKILNKKPILTNNNETYIDLLPNTFNSTSYITGSFLVVNQYYVARPDLISLAVYGDDQFGDIICKVNGISNPFELNENDIIYIPSPDSLSSLTQRQESPSELITSENDDLKNKDYIDNRKKLSDRRSPNELVIGESNYIIDHSHGLVFY